MGVVYEAEQESLGRRVALKLVRPELLYFEGARERFRREIEAVARLQHPAIVPVLASGEQDGVPFYAMELMQGRTVQEVCSALADREPSELRAQDLRSVLGTSDESDTDPLRGAWWQACVRIAHTVALGVRHAHLRGIVHRDIKPSNIMLTRDGRTVLLDFGVALLGGSREFTRTGNTPGSPAFMSPEQLRGDAVDERTDVYSLGATLWQMLCLVPPFRGDSDLQRIRDGDVPSLTARNHEVPHELVVVVQKAMDRDRERRYADVEAFADDLVAVMQRRPIRARRLGLSLRTWRWCQRHRVVATALASLLFGALLLPAVFAWRERASNRELAAAVAAAETSAQTANQSLATTLDAIHSLLVVVGEEKLRYVPGGDAVAQQALRDAVAMYRQLLRRHPDEPRLVGNAADAFARYALQRVRSGDLRGGRAVLLEEIALLGGEQNDVPAGRLLKRSLAHIHLGDLAVQSEDVAEATRCFDAAERELAALVGNEPLRIDVMRHQVELAATRIGMLDPRVDSERLQAICTAAADIARRLCAEKQNPSDTRQLVSLLRIQGALLARTQRPSEALAPLDEALRLARSIPADAPIWPPQPQAIAGVLLTLGNTYVQLRDQRASAALKECLQLREDGVRDHPSDVLLRSELGAVLHALAEMNVAQAQDERALERLERAIALQRAVVADLPEFRQGHDYLRKHLTVRGTTLARLGRASDLSATASELEAMRDDASAQRTAARHLLRLATLRAAPDTATDPALPDVATCRERALACLLRADQLGWSVDDRLTDDLYAPLRERAEFQALRERLANRQAKPSRER